MSANSVILVDDDPVVRHLLSSALFKMSVDLNVLSSGKECIAFIKNNTLNHTAPSLLIIDLQLADMTGEELINILSSYFVGNLPNILLLSSYSEDEVIHRHPGLLKQCQCFLEKPFPLSSFSSEVMKLIKDQPHD